MLLTAARSVTIIYITHCCVFVATVVTRTSQNSTFSYIAYFVKFMAILAGWFVLNCLTCASWNVHHLSAAIKYFRLSRCDLSCEVLLVARMRFNQWDVRRNLVICISLRNFRKVRAPPVPHGRPCVVAEISTRNVSEGWTVCDFSEGLCC